MSKSKTTTVKLASGNTIKVSTDLMLRIARSAEQLRKSPIKRQPHPNDNKSLRELFDI